ncbi:TFIIH basal transcription factor complex, subunit SSL1 [Bimuria novae-zelandiae CBS 107.79]|uniref:General transcription and DNA repair factor IIH n=1 Tax=Bimuria novae-zelandiae CBS 107.79 TaxID=1447943 RepID=A0A6A5UZD4_9PLEO|nr:TFIIH basal transcription factor complex, subunit SSL1 [Bimuria novae-zelandiae CBS 107.79]
MSGSDYSGSEYSGSDDEYVGPRGGGSNAAAARRMVEAQQQQAKKAERKAQAWERRRDDSSEEEEYVPTFEEVEDTDVPEKSIQQMEEERKRKRLRKDTKPFQRGIIRHVVLVLDLSEAMLEKDMRPTRFHAMIQYAQEYVREFFEQNPISQMSVLGMHDGLCLRVSELSGNPADHITAIQGLRTPKNPQDFSKEPKGSPSLQNALELARATLYHTPSHGTREVIIVFGSLLSLDPGDIHQTIKDCVRDRVRVSVIGMSARLKICTEIVSRTNAGDESEYVVATDQELLRELLLATTTPPVVRTSKSAQAVASPESAAALMMMGFPSRVVEDTPTMCACHGILTTGGYTCSRCSTKVCSLPITCPSCQLTLLLSTHLARSYHHLFPLRNWAEVHWQRAREKGTKACLACLTPFPEPPPPDDTHREKDTNGHGVNGGMNRFVEQAQMDWDESGEQKASESSRYECRACESHFCIDCDMFCHIVLHNCPGCLSKADPPDRRTGEEMEITP